MDSNFPSRKSLFEIEAERMAELNKDKGKDPNKKSFGETCVLFAVGGFFGFLLLAPATIYGVMSSAFVAMKLWNWFVVPTFGLPLMHMAPMAGIYWLVRFFVFSFPNFSTENKSWKRKAWEFVGLALMPWFALLVGFIIKHFV